MNITKETLSFKWHFVNHIIHLFPSKTTQWGSTQDGSHSQLKPTPKKQLVVNLDGKQEVSVGSWQGRMRFPQAWRELSAISCQQTAMLESPSRSGDRNHGYQWTNCNLHTKWDESSTCVTVFWGSAANGHFPHTWHFWTSWMRIKRAGFRKLNMPQNLKQQQQNNPNQIVEEFQISHGESHNRGMNLGWTSLFPHSLRRALDRIIHGFTSWMTTIEVALILWFLWLLIANGVLGWLTKDKLQPKMIVWYLLLVVTYPWLLLVVDLCWMLVHVEYHWLLRGCKIL